MTITIIKRQYDLIVKHATESFPSEAGGFIGGKEDIILGIFPVPNFEKWFHKDKIAFMWDEITKNEVESIFFRYNLKTIGLYHSHPNGIAYPSIQDFLAHKEYGLKISIIAGIQKGKLNKMNAFVMPEPNEEEYKRREFKKEELQIIEDFELEYFLKQKELEKEIKSETQKYIEEQEKLKKTVESILNKSNR